MLRICGDFGNFRGTDDLPRFWIRQITDFEPLLQSHQKGSRVENFTEGSFGQKKGAVKILWPSEHGKAIKMSLGMQKFGEPTNLTRKRSRMEPTMGILRRLKTVKHTANCVDAESENGFSIASLDVEPLAFEDRLRGKRLEFIVGSILVCINWSRAL